MRLEFIVTLEEHFWTFGVKKIPSPILFHVLKYSLNEKNKSKAFSFRTAVSEVLHFPLTPKRLYSAGVSCAVDVDIIRTHTGTFFFFTANMM